MGEKQTMGRSTDEVMAAVQAKRKAEVASPPIFMSQASSPSDFSYSGLVPPGAKANVQDQMMCRQLREELIREHAGKQWSDDTPAPLPTDEQIASLLKENERLARIEKAASDAFLVLDSISWTN